MKVRIKVIVILFFFFEGAYAQDGNLKIGPRLKGISSVEQVRLSENEYMF